MGDVDVSDELGSNRNRKEDDLQVLTVNEIPALAPPIDGGNMVMSKGIKDLQSHP
jgi:hypothetical protein